MSAVGKKFDPPKWPPLPFGIRRIAMLTGLRFRLTFNRTKKRKKVRRKAADDTVCLATPWEIEAYRLLPLRHISRIWGWLTELYIPLWCRSSILGLYVRAFGCDMTEAEEEDILKYTCLSQLFRRSLKPSLRPISSGALITSPVDGTLLEVSLVNCGTLHQIKGVRYSMRRFLGPNVWNRKRKSSRRHVDPDCCYHQSCLTNPSNNELYQAVIYLAPGDYHRFHSPADWSVSLRRHFPGELLSVNPSYVAWIEDLFVLNERVVYVGSWEHGFMSMTAVGATNVGSIHVYFDPKLKTNKINRNNDQCETEIFGKKEPVNLKKGDPFGEFNLGSTIVLIFEAPKNAVLEVVPGQKIKLGEAFLRL